MEQFFSIVEDRDEFSEWKKVIISFTESLTPSVISDEEFKTLLRQTHEVKNFVFLCQSFYRYKKYNPDERSVYVLFASHVDSSPNGMDDWAQALMRFHIWLEEHNKTSDLKTMLGYLICCASSPENKDTKQSLADLFIQMINEFGFEVAKDKL